MPEGTPEAQLRKQIAWWRERCDPAMAGYEAVCLELCDEIEALLDARAKDREAQTELIAALLRPDGNGHVHCPVCLAWKRTSEERLMHKPDCELARVEALLTD